MNDDLDFQIGQKEEELRPICLCMEELRLEFVNNFAVFVSKWFEEMARNYVTKKSEITLNMSKEKIGQMKAKVTELVRDSEEIANEALQPPTLWWHEKPEAHALSTNMNK